MQPSEMIAAIDEEITRLEQARNLLSGIGTGPAHRGRPAGAFSGGTAPRKRRTVSAAGRARIVAAQKKRWARVKRASKPAAAPTPAKAIARPKKRKAAKSSAARVRTKRKITVRKAPAKAAAPGTPAPIAEASAS